MNSSIMRFEIEDPHGNDPKEVYRFEVWQGGLYEGWSSTADGVGDLLANLPEGTTELGVIGLLLDWYPNAYQVTMPPDQDQTSELSPCPHCHTPPGGWHKMSCYHPSVATSRYWHGWVWTTPTMKDCQDFIKKYHDLSVFRWKTMRVVEYENSPYIRWQERQLKPGEPMGAIATWFPSWEACYCYLLGMLEGGM